MQNQIKMKYFVIFYISIFISLIDTLHAEEVNNTFSHTYHVKPLLDYFLEVQNKLYNHDTKIKSKDSVIRELKVKVAEITLQNEQKDKTIEVYKQLDQANTAQIDLLNENIRLLRKTCESTQHELDQMANKEQNSQIIKLQAQIDLDSEKIQKYEYQIVKNIDLIKEKDEIILNHLQNLTISANKTQIKLEEFKRFNFEGQVSSCLPFATPGIHTIRVPGMDPFNVLCASAAIGAGWTVIQQRINGREDFYRDWKTYKTGFGSFDGDFFLGLEKIHQLTNSQRHELYIHVERFNGQITYAAYDHFAIAGEDDQYELINVDGFSGNTTDSRDNMKYHKYRKFYTFDRDNELECANKHHAGYWFYDCADSNLNGIYFDRELKNRTAIIWYDNYSLKKVQMLIRPKF